MDTFATTEEATSEKDEGDSSRVNRKTNIDSLPEELLAFEILARIPAQDIVSATRLVRRKWYQMMNSTDFIHAHLRHSTCGLLIQNVRDPENPPSFIAMRKGRIEFSKLSHEYTNLSWSSCNGLILGPREDYSHLYVKNLVKKRRFTLPPFAITSNSSFGTIAYAPTSMEYKVVHTFISPHVNSFSGSIRSAGCAILTVGIDKSWRRLFNVSQSAMEILVGTCPPLATHGFVHWGREGNVLTLNVETETFTESQISICRGEKRLEYYYLSAGSYLSLLIACSGFSWEIWEMKPESGDWKKMGKIDLEAQRSTFNNVLYCDLLKPVGWLNYPEVLVFNACNGLLHNCLPNPTRGCFTYNVRTKEIDSFKLESYRSKFLVHRDSLVWLNGF